MLHFWNLWGVGISLLLKGLHRWLNGKESACRCGRPGFNSWLRKIPWRRKWQPTPVCLLGESHGQSSLAGYSPWSRKELDTTQWLNNNDDKGCMERKKKKQDRKLSLRANPSGSGEGVCRIFWGLWEVIKVVWTGESYILSFTWWIFIGTCYVLKASQVAVVIKKSVCQ